MRSRQKIIIATLCVILIISLAACGKNRIFSAPHEPGIPGIPTGDERSLRISVGSYVYDVTLYDNQTVKQLIELLPQTFNMEDLNGNEKYCYLPQHLPTQSENIGKINSGDIMLYGSDCVVIFYESFATNYSYTRIGKIVDITGLKTAFCKGSVIVTFDLFS